MNASELMLNAMLVASACDVAQAPNQQDEHGEAHHVQQHLKSARPAEVQDAAHQLPVEPHAGERAETLAMLALQRQQRRTQSP